MPAGPPAHLRDELLRRRRLVVRADLVIWHQAPNLAAEARGSPSSTAANHAAAVRITRRNGSVAGQAATELPVGRKGGRTRHVRTVCGGNLARVRFPPPPCSVG